MKTFAVIGDVHGCIDEFREMLDLIRTADSKAQIMTVGDLINKGPDSMAVLELVRNLNIKIVLGNHELKFLRFCEQEQSESDHPLFYELKISMGHQLHHWLKWLKKFPLVFEHDLFRMVHAGFPPGVTSEKHMDPWLLTTIRTWDGQGIDLNNPADPAWYEFYTDPKLCVFGHWAMRGLVTEPHVIGLDSGCVYGRKLSAVLLPSRQIIQVSAQKAYTQ